MVTVAQKTPSKLSQALAGIGQVSQFQQQQQGMQSRFDTQQANIQGRFDETNLIKQKDFIMEFETKAYANEPNSPERKFYQMQGKPRGIEIDLAKPGVYSNAQVMQGLKSNIPTVRQEWGKRAGMNKIDLRTTTEIKQSHEAWNKKIAGLVKEKETAVVAHDTETARTATKLGEENILEKRGEEIYNVGRQTAKAPGGMTTILKGTTPIAVKDTDEIVRGNLLEEKDFAKKIKTIYSQLETWFSKKGIPVNTLPLSTDIPGWRDMSNTKLKSAVKKHYETGKDGPEVGAGSGKVLTQEIAQQYVDRYGDVKAAKEAAARDGYK